jgi:hypothetical protein
VVWRRLDAYGSEVVRRPSCPTRRVGRSGSRCAAVAGEQKCFGRVANTRVMGVVFALIATAALVIGVSRVSGMWASAQDPYAWHQATRSPRVSLYRALDIAKKGVIRESGQQSFRELFDHPVTVRYGSYDFPLRWFRSEFDIYSSADAWEIQISGLKAKTCPSGRAEIEPMPDKGTRVIFVIDRTGLFWMTPPCVGN